MQRKKILVAFADGFFRLAQAEVTGKGAIDARKTALGILEINEVRLVVHQRLQQVAFLREHVLIFFTLGNVLFDGDKILNSARRIADRRDRHLLIVSAAILAHVDQFAVPACAGLNGRPHAGVKLRRLMLGF